MSKTNGTKNRIADVESADAVQSAEDGDGAPVKKPKGETVMISAPKFRIRAFRLKGTAPFMQARFSLKAMQAMMAKMAAGSTAGKGKKREPRDFDDDFKQAQHISTEGWVGIPASAFRNACIDVCRMVGFKMTHAKMSVFTLADGHDAIDGTPLVRLLAGEPERTELPVRNATGVMDIRIRPLWREWGCVLRVRFDEDQFTSSDIANLVRAGVQVGVGEGRPYSRDSNGLGFGTWELSNDETEAK